MDVVSDQSGGSSVHSAEVHTPVSSMTASGKFALASQLIMQLANLIEGPPETFAKRIAVLRDIKAAWGANREVTVGTQDESFGTSAFQAVDSSATNLAIKQEPQPEEMPRIENVVGYGHHPVETAGSFEGSFASDESVDPSASTSKTGNRLNTSSLYQDLGKQRIQIKLPKLEITEASATLASGVNKRKGDGSKAGESHHGPAIDFQDDSSSYLSHPTGSSADDTDSISDKATKTHQTTSKASHLNVDNEPTALVCRTCGKSFQLGELSSDRPFSCPHCQQSTSKPSLVQGVTETNKRGIKETLPVVANSTNASEMSDRPFPCSLCSKPFKSRSHLIEHIRIHTRDKPFSCNVCGKEFRTKSNRNGHQKIHRRKIVIKTSQTSYKRSNMEIKAKKQKTLKSAAQSPKSTSETSGFDLAQDDGGAHPSTSNPNQTSQAIDHRYPCDVCDVTFSTKATLKSHQNGHCQCQICKMLFPRKEDLRLHEKMHRTSEKSRPVFGPKAIQKKYVQLRRSRSTKKSFTCSVCNKVLQTLKGLQKHQLTHTGDRPHACMECQKRFSSANNLTVHMRIHTDERPFECKLCKNRFRQGSHLTSHWKTVHNKTVLKCRVCPRIFIDPDERKNHELVQHNMNEGESPVRRNLFKNIEVQAASSSSKNVSSSTRSEKQAVTSLRDFFPCNECGKLLKTASALQAHSKVHGLTESHQCTRCRKTFSNNSNLRRHIAQSHVNSREFKCNICGKQFLQERTLKQHKSIHVRKTHSESVAPGVSLDRELKTVRTVMIKKNKKGIHQCPYCQKILGRKGSLNDHIRSHTNEKPYACRFCDETFKQRSTRRSHEQLVHEGSFNCSICPCTFSTKLALGEHLRIQHKLKSSPNKSDRKESISAAYGGQSRDESGHINVTDGSFGEAQLSKSFTGVGKAVNKGKHCCRFCGKSLSSRTRLLCHEKLHANKESLVCNICRRTFQSTGNLAEHMQTHQRKKMASSSGTFSLSKARKQTVAMKPIRQVKRRFKCHYCEKLLIKKSHLLEHERIHTGEKPFECDECEAKFATKSTLSSHRKTHLKSPSNQFADQRRSPRSQVASGNTSPKVANANTALNRQVANIGRSLSPRVTNANTSHSPKDASTCRGYSPRVATAGRSHSPKVTNASASHSHQIVNEGRSPIPRVASTGHSNQVSESRANHSSPRVDANSNTISQLSSAVVIQSGQATKSKSPVSKQGRSPHEELEVLSDPEKNQKNCGRVYRSPEKLGFHEKAHESEGTGLQSLGTEGSYSISDEMTSGKKVPCAERIIQCSFCEKTCKRPSDLIRHERTHTGEKPFVCDCGKAFTSKSSLNYHMRNSCRLTKQTKSTL